MSGSGEGNMDTHSGDDEGGSSSSHHEITKLPIRKIPGSSPVLGSSPTRKKRRADSNNTFAESTGAPPLKRMKGDFNSAYVDLLNRDIEDASSGIIHGQEDRDSEPLQIGLVVWSAAERSVFYAALRRLGKDDVAGISARVGSKSEVEVRQYLLLLDAAGRRRGGNGEGNKTLLRDLRPVHVPAAVEIGPDCAAALEIAADTLSLLQEGYEQKVEKARWGSRWLITPALAHVLEASQQSHKKHNHKNSLRRIRLRERSQSRQQDNESEDEGSDSQEDQEEDDGDEFLRGTPFLEFFSIQTWLELSDRIFMNSTLPDNNWRFVSEEDEPPAIQATALADFYGLAVSFTKRLLLAVLFMAQSRLRTRSQKNPTRKRPNAQIRVEDVAAAVSSLGLKRNSSEFWVRCARRLQLKVVDDEIGEDDIPDSRDEDPGIDADDDVNSELPGSEDTEDSEPDTEEDGEESESEEDNDMIMSYDEVETALGYPANDTHGRPSTPKSTADIDPDDIPNASEEDVDEEIVASGEEDDEYHNEASSESSPSSGTEDTSMRDANEPPHSETDDDPDTALIQQDIEEAALARTWIEPSDDTDTLFPQHARKSQIRAEHKNERYAEQRDMKASKEAEKKLWAMLRRDDSKNSGDDSDSPAAEGKGEGEGDDDGGGGGGGSPAPRDDDDDDEYADWWGSWSRRNEQRQRQRATSERSRSIRTSPRDFGNE
ncbi:hypothetical protein F4777DRAFT_259598 [Nemania sp. FL0916]|nr:hypothetical protein F4777DRAFT_259598 [Nemania sp. FL0916]